MIEMLYLVQGGLILAKLLQMIQYSWFVIFIPLYIIFAIYVMICATVAYARK